MNVRYPERVVYPVAGFRKRDVIDFYDRVSSAILPHLRRKAEIEHVEQTAGGRLRHAAFRKLNQPRINAD